MRCCDDVIVCSLNKQLVSLIETKSELYISLLKALATGDVMQGVNE